MEIKWDKKFLNINYLENTQKFIHEIIMSHFDKQVGADGKKFPNKKSGDGKFLQDTGAMINSLDIKYNSNNDSISVHLKNKENIYKEYLHPRAELIGLSKNEIEMLLDEIKRNLKKKGY
jgi:hypothetical protein